MSAYRDLVEFITKSVPNAENRSYGNIVPEEDITPGPSGSLVIKGLDNTDVEALNNVLREGGFEQGLDLGRIGKIFDGTTDDFNPTTVFENIKKNNEDLFKYLKRDKQSMDAMVAMANATGFENIAVKFLNRKPGQILPAEDTLAGILTLIKFGKELQYGAHKAYRSLDRQTRETEFKKLQVMAAVQSNLAAQVSGNVSEYARGLGVVSSVAKLENLDISAYAESLDTWVREADEGLVDYHLHTFLQLSTPMQRARYAEKGFVSKSWDFAMENYINALLSAPSTHIVNIAGNAGFQVQTLAERGLAGVIGNIRTLGGLRGDIGDQRYVGEAAAEAHGLAMALGDATLLMAKTMVTGESGDLVSKIDLRTRRALGSTDNLNDIKTSMAQGDFFKSTVDLLGISTRLPGRFLASEDEFYKVITMRRVLYREAHRASQIAYTTARREGIGRDEAKELASQKYADMITTTPDEIKKMMTTEARKMTFQGAPDGFFGRMGPLINSVPLIKTVVPFYNTPTNIINEAFDRTLNWSPVYRAIKQTNLPGTQMMPGGNTPISGKELDDALAKLSLGNGIALGMLYMASGEYGDNIVITGTGPSEFAAKRNIMDSAGFNPASIGIKQPDGTYETFTFSRFDPMSALLVMGADLANYMRYEDDPNLLSAAIKGYVLATAEYASSLPFLQGVAELSEFAMGRGTKEDAGQRVMQYFGQLSSGVGTNVLGNLDRSTFGLGSYVAHYLGEGQYTPVTQSSFHAMLERMNDPTASNTALPPGKDPITGKLYTEAPLFMQGFYSGLQKAKARNPYFADTLPPGLDFWGNEVVRGQGTLIENFNPTRLRTARYSKVDQELLRLSETGMGTFSMHNKSINQVKLNSEEINEFHTLINTVDANGNTPEETGYDPSSTLANALLFEVLDADYQSLITDEDKFKALNTILNDRRELAREAFIEGSTRFQLTKMVEKAME